LVSGWETAEKRRVVVAAAPPRNRPKEALAPKARQEARLDNIIMARTACRENIVMVGFFRIRQTGRDVSKRKIPMSESQYYRHCDGVRRQICQMAHHRNLMAQLLKKKNEA
jgi:hypothetical protein